MKDATFVKIFSAINAQVLHFAKYIVFVKNEYHRKKDSYAECYCRYCRLFYDTPEKVRNHEKDRKSKENWN